MIERICLNCLNFIRQKKAPDKFTQGVCRLDGMPTSVQWSCSKFDPNVIEVKAKKKTKRVSSVAA